MRKHLLALVICVVGISIATAQEAVTPHHLVGHEELELLDRAQDVIDDWDSRKLENPLVVTSQSVDGDGRPVIRKQLRRSDLAEFIADIDAVEALGKAFFWEMQAGSDFRKGPNGIMIGTACATCHYRHGADARSRHSRRIPFVAWNEYPLHPEHSQLEFGERQQPFPVAALSTQTVKFGGEPREMEYSRIVGSQGVEPRVFTKLNPSPTAIPPDGWESESSIPRPFEDYEHRPEWTMFIDGDFAKDNATGIYSLTERRRFRQITNRNSPTTINSGFSNRLFHDGRAESTFNGFSIFGDADPREVIHRRRVTQIVDAEGKIVGETIDIVPVHVAITNAALASQAVGPIVNEIEMSYLGRQFPNVAHKLLEARILGFQHVDPQDSVLANWGVGREGALTYKQLIQRAFRREWWDDSGTKTKTPLILLRDSDRDGFSRGSLMEANFSLYWGLAIMMYEASLVSNQSPFDDMMRGRSEKVEAKWTAVKAGNGPDDQLQPISRDQRTSPPPEHLSGSAVFQHGFRVFMNRGCIDCHGGPLFTELSKRRPEDEKFAIHQEIERSLLPNSRADFLAAQIRAVRAALLSQLSAEIESSFATAKHRSQKIAHELDLLRQSSRGEKAVLKANSERYLQQAFPASNATQRQQAAERIAAMLFEYEKGLIAHMGNRPFFTEAERIVMAEPIAERVLVEKMPVPEKQWDTRPRLPIQPPLALEKYTFYDLAFYVLGVSLPRYDRGIGDRKDGLILLSESVEDVATQMMSSDSAEDRAVARVAREALDANQAAAQVLESVMSDPKKVGLTNQAKQRFVDEVRRQVSSARPSSSPGNAYRFHRQWKSEKRYQSELENIPRAMQESVPENARQSDEGPMDIAALDEAKGPLIDTSWDRIDIPFGDVQTILVNGKPTEELIPGPGRRSEYYFLSRARRLVFNEEFWGYRKPFLHDNELSFWGAFKTPSLRNVELTAPYMHNGRFMTLLDVVEFYEGDGDRNQVPRDRNLNPDKHPEMNGFDLTESDKRALVFFLMCLTDDRVRREEGPFDHPSLELVNGYRSQGPDVYEEVLQSIPSVGRGGHTHFSPSFSRAD